MRTIALGLGILFLSARAAGQDAREPVPPAADVKKAEKVIHDFFRTEYQAKDPAARSALAEKLIKEAGATRSDAITVYVLLSEACDLAAEAGNVSTAFEAIDKMSARFDVKAADLKAEALVTARKKASSPESLSAIAAAGLALAEEQIRAGNFDGALKAARETEGAARSARDSAAAQNASNLVKDIPGMKRAHEIFAKAEMTLSTNPADPDACLTCGRYLCLVRGDWEAGLPLLAKGSNPALVEAAMKELARPETGQGQAELADLWFEVSEKERNAPDKRRWQAHAKAWYERASAGTTGILQLRVQKRLADLESSGAGSAGAAGGPSVDLLRLIDPAKDAVSGTWSLSGKILVAAPPEPAVLQIPYSPPAEYDLTIVTEKKDRLLFYVGLLVAGTQVSVFLDSMSSTLSCIGVFGKGIEGETSTVFSGEALSKASPSTVVCSVRRTGIAVSVDGKKLLEFKGNLKKLVHDPGFRVPDNRALGIGSNCLYHISKILLTPVSGQGRRLR